MDGARPPVTRLGAAAVTRVAELDHWPFPAADMFPAVPGAVPREELDEDGTVDFAIAVWVIRLGDRTILVDAGNGADKDRPVLTAHHRLPVDLPARLTEAGVPPASVDTVVITHLHPDHAGGLTTLAPDGRWKPTFPGAEHLLPAADLAWVGQLADGPPPDGPAADIVRTWHDSVVPVLAGCRHRAVDGDLELAREDGTVVRTIVTGGHSPGHLVVEIASPDGDLVVTGDAIHHRLQLSRPGIGHAGDADPARAQQVREELLDRARRTGTLLATAHFRDDRPVALGAAEHG